MNNVKQQILKPTFYLFIRMSVNQFSRKEIAIAYIKILRLVNGLVSGCAAAFGVVLSFPDGITLTPNDYVAVALVVIAGMFVSCQAMIFNDIADREEDAINAPHRPIPTGKISVKAAKIYAFIFVGLALGAAIAIDILRGLYGLSVATAIIFGGSLVLYDFKLKKMGFIGNLTIGINVLALFLYGSLHTYLVYPESGLAWIPIVVGVAAGSGNVGREIIKGLPDIEGDRKAGIPTIAVKYGQMKTAIIADIFLAILIAGGFSAIFLDGLNYPASAIVGYATIIPVATFAFIGILVNQKPKWAYITKEILLILYLVFLLLFIVDKIIFLIIG